jgi:hypothetical protein
MFVGAELVAQVVWPEEKLNSCVVPDKILPFRYQANCTSTMKAAEGPWYTNRYNECGYRSAESCGPAPAGTRRIAVIGQSVGEGYMVEYPDTIGARLGADLTAMCGRSVQVQNLAATGYTGHRLALRMDEALALRPAAIVLPQNPFDIEAELDDTTDPFTGSVTSAQASRSAQAPAYKPSLFQRLESLLTGTRTVTVAQHFLFRNQSVYLPVYLHYGDKANFLRPPFTPSWQERLRRFDLLISDLSSRAHQANVPLILVFVPHQAELELMKSAFVPPGIDPEALPRAMETIAARHGVIFIDSSTALRAEPAPQDLYYTVDGHPSGRGQPVIARAIAQNFVNLADGPFADCRARDGGHPEKTTP